MSGRVRGRDEVSLYLKGLPAELTNVLRGAARAGAAVVAEDAKRRSRSDYVAENVVLKSKVETDHVRVTVTVKAGFARSIAIWLEYSTSPHFISVDESARDGRTAGRINRNATTEFKGTLLINGKPVGATVFHPGAQSYPFLRPALDAQRTEAIEAALAYVRSRISGGAVVPDSSDEKDEQ